MFSCLVWQSPLWELPGGHHLTRGTSAGWDARCHFRAAGPVPAPPPAYLGVPRALKQLLLNHLVKCLGFFFRFIFNTDQFADLIFHVASGGALGRNSCAKINSVWWEQVAEGQECWAGAVPRSTAARALLPPVRWMPLGPWGHCQGLQQSADGGCCTRMVWGLQYNPSGGSDITNQLWHLHRAG